VDAGLAISQRTPAVAATGWADEVTRLSYVVQADAWEVVAELASALEQQISAEEIELLLVSERPLDVDDHDAISVRVLVREGSRGSRGRVEGVREAAGDVVALGETHVVPAPGWARACLDAHDAGADAVLPRMTIANPRSALSWASFLMDYGRYAGHPTASTAIPTYNATFRRDALLALPDLGRVIVPGPYLDQALRERGATVAHAPGAVLAHVNIDRPVHWLRERLAGGLLLGRSRRRRFGLPRRVAYIAAFPLIAVVLYVRALGAPREGSPRGTLPALALACVIYATGEAGGSIGLSGDRAERQMLDYEVHKRSYVRHVA
jgi:hypothetical protein